MTTTRKAARTGAAIIAGLVLAAGPLGAAHAQSAKELYDKSCLSCHGAGGKGDGPAAKLLKPPPGDFAQTLPPMADADIAKIIKEGGKAVGKAPTMAAFGNKLTDEQVQALVQYVKGLIPQ